MMTFCNFLKDYYFDVGVYVASNLSEKSSIQLCNWFETNIPYFQQFDDPHCTIIYSKKPQHYFHVPQGRYLARVKSFDLFGENKNILVATLDSHSLVTRHNELMTKNNFVYDYPNYQPHVSLCEVDMSFDLKSLQPIDFDLVFDIDYAEPLTL